MRASVRVIVALVCTYAVWLSSTVSDGAVTLATQRIFDSGAMDAVRQYVTRHHQIESVRDLVTPVGALSGGLLADFLGGELVLLGLCASSAATLFLVVRAPESMSVIGLQAAIEAAVMPALFTVLARTHRRRLGMLAAVAYCGSRVVQELYFRLQGTAFDLDWPTKGRRLGMYLLAITVISSLAVGITRTKQSSRDGRDDPYRTPEESPDDMRTSVTNDWKMSLRDQALWWMLPAVFAAGAVCHWLPMWWSTHLFFPNGTGGFEHVQRLGLYVALGLLAASLVLLDLVPRRRAEAVAIMLAVLVGLDAWLMKGPSGTTSLLAISDDQQRAFTTTSLVAILPAVFVVMAGFPSQVRERGVGLRCALASGVAALAAWSTRPIFLDSSQVYQLVPQADNRAYMLTAIAVVLCFVALRRPVSADSAGVSSVDPQ